MGKAGAGVGSVIGGLLSLIITLILISMPTGTEGINEVANQNITENPEAYIEGWFLFLIIFLIANALLDPLGALLGHLAEEAIQSM